MGRQVGPLDDLRAALDAAIVAQRWDAVTAIHARIAELDLVQIDDDDSLAEVRDVLAALAKLGALDRHGRRYRIRRRELSSKQRPCSSP